MDILDFNFKLLSMDDTHRHKGSKQLLQPGRVVVLVDGVYLHFRLLEACG